MEQPPAFPNSTPPAPSTGKILFGIVLMAAWICLHVVLFYVFAVSGFLVELFVGFLRTIFVNDKEALSSIGTAWELPLALGLFIAGAAGIPLGLARFCLPQQMRLKKAFWLMLLLGFIFELYALSILISSLFGTSA